MVKMKYVGPGAGDDPKTIEVEEAEVQPLEKTGLWKKASTKKASVTKEKDGE